MRSAMRSAYAVDIVSHTNRPEWLAHCTGLPAGDIIRPQNEEVFTCCEGLEGADTRNTALRRLNRYGIVSGQFFVTKHSDLKKLRFTFACSFHSEKPRNNWDLKPEVELD